MFVFSSAINVNKRDELERIMFFNQNQKQFHPNIIRLIEVYGRPSIVEKDNKLRIILEKVNCQNLFIRRGNNLVGALIYHRNLPDNIDLIHIAVDEKYSSTGVYAGEMIVLRMIKELKRIVLMIKGVKKVSVSYKQKRKIYSVKRSYIQPRSATKAKDAIVKSYSSLSPRQPAP
jgi:hypothetical protein